MRPAVLLVLASCNQPTPVGEAPPDPPSVPPPAATAPATAPPPPATVEASSAVEADSAPTATATQKPAIEAPSLFGEDGELLPQTEDEPRLESPLFQHRARSLFEAIAKDDPEIARDFFFPRAAYEKVKAIKNPGRDWDARLWKLFVRDVHDYHEKLGPEPVTFLRIEVPIEKSEWMKPHREGNAIGYHRVKRAQVVYADADEKEHRLEITSMISWRGEWYVVHLHGFK